MRRFHHGHVRATGVEQEPAAEAAPRVEVGPGMQALGQLTATGGATPESVAALIARHPAERDAMMAHLHETLGNAFVAEVVELLEVAPEAPATQETAPEAGTGQAEQDKERPPGVEPLPNPLLRYFPPGVEPEPHIRPPGVEPEPSPPVRPPSTDPSSQDAPPQLDSMAIRTFIATGKLPSGARSAAEAWNLRHIPNVVRFDRATHGNFAKINGQLDADKVALAQWRYELPVTGCATDESINRAKGGPPRPLEDRLKEVPQLDPEEKKRLEKLLTTTLNGREGC